MDTVFVGAAIQGRFQSTNTPTPAGPFEPPPTHAVRGHSVSAVGVDKEGLAEAAETAMRAIQTELHRVSEPLDRLRAMQLDHAGQLARLALYRLGGGTWKLAKEVDASVAAPDGPLAICLGSSSREEVTAQTGSGRTLLVPLGMYGGCLRTFPSNPAAKHWPARWCDECRRLRQTNERKKAVSRLRRRAADGY